ncbi:hypothetical protein MHC_03405 [Mycoplasma haemocanis str. Illinois]|uniref:Uncharacterized protein n=1 Tax=Mycoplasma haemocanis (strain Illinois) TaxID=1111676 RepID=H6N7B9_MYCHN|nr:hypothetical protein [Mycoplasma haemocanis]AEW45541.1 hypothetical protein MHC_03405 [Mycoplasma haemocanis str. Illinois]
MVFSSGSFWGGVLLVGASIGIGSVLLPEQIFESLELTSAKTRSAEESNHKSEEAKSESVQSTSASAGHSEESSSKTAETSQASPETSSNTSTPAVTQKSGCTIHKLISSVGKSWQFEKVEDKDSFLKGRTDSYKRIKEVCDKSEGKNILVKKKNQSWWPWRQMEWDYDGKDQDGAEFKKYLDEVKK